MAKRKSKALPRRAPSDFVSIQGVVGGQLHYFRRADVIGLIYGLMPGQSPAPGVTSATVALSSGTLVAVGETPQQIIGRL
ncbi:MAG: hypothetical protein JOZ70_13170 [Pseudolabrys sp.]|nr:hypothetical protein [Pseudolabrys sp.]